MNIAKRKYRLPPAGAVTLVIIGSLTNLLMSGCTSTPVEEHYLKLYPGPVRLDSDIAIVRLGDADTAKFDGRVAARQDWSEVHLLPGEHSIELKTFLFGVSVMIEPSGFATGGNGAKIMLMAGHVYTLKADRTTGNNYRLFFWIVDNTDQQVVAGTPKP